MAYENPNYESFYSGGYSSLNPEYGNFIGHRLSAGALSSPTGIQTANQLNEVVARIREGVKNVELQPLQGDVFEQIPKQHFKEMKALMQLSGVKPSVHAPMVDPAGFGEKGWGGDTAREDVERKLFSVVEKSQELDPNGNIPIVIHSTGGVPGREWRPKEGTKPGDKDRFEEWKGAAINQDTGEMAGLKREKMFRPSHPESLDIEAKEGEMWTPEQRIHSINEGQWEQKLTELAQFKKHANEIMGNAPLVLKNEIGRALTEKDFERFSHPQTEEDRTKAVAYNQLKDADIFLENAQLGFTGAFEQAFKYGSKEQRRILKGIAEQYKKGIGQIGQDVKNKKGKIIGKAPVIGSPVMKKEVLDRAVQSLAQVTSMEYGHNAPQTFVPVEEFAMDKAATTFGNIAAKSYEKFGKNAPIIAIENWQPEMAFARAEDMKALVEASKKKFIDRAKKSKKDGGLGMSTSRAKKHANKVLGVTWDVGHINEFRKFGFKKEDIIQETKKIAPLVKHVHLTDNFGYSDSHLPPGMGNVPIKEMLEEMEKAGTLKNTRAVVEAGPFAVGFKKSPFPLALEAMGSPIYGAKMAPYWNQVMGVQGNYFEFPMAHMPEKHFSMYGSGFSMLPEELGGQMPGTQSRFAGTPNA